MTTNLLKRLESSVEAFRLTLRALSGNIEQTLDAISTFERIGGSATVTDDLGDPGFDADDEDMTGLDEFTVGQEDSDQPLGHGPAVVEARSGSRSRPDPGPYHLDGQGRSR